jgi:hypothetical protein
VGISICEIRAAGAKSNAVIAAKLNERRVPTARSGIWTHVQVRSVISRGGPSPLAFRASVP